MTSIDGEAAIILYLTGIISPVKPINNMKITWRKL
jgi:hypothetical protein